MSNYAGISVVCVRTGLTMYAGSTVIGGLVQDWSVNVFGCIH